MLGPKEGTTRGHGLCLHRPDPRRVHRPAAAPADHPVPHVPLRQRFHAGFGDAPDDRTRDQEFADRTPQAAEQLSTRAAATFAEVDTFLSALAPARLAEKRTLQAQSATLLEMLVSTLPHIAEHVGQIMYIAKAQQGAGFPSLSIPLPKGPRTE